ncbi:MAG: hypothetical protein U5M51_05865 [Emticicia sp.]|nr:hypothetical protein [Emticicia sp.]
MKILILSALLIGGCRVNDPVANPALNTDYGKPPYSIVDGDTIKTVVFKDYKKLKDKDPNGKNYITVGDTIVLYKEPKLHTPPAKDPDLSKLKNNDDPDLKGKPLRYVAIGGSLTAGVRDGGYFNEGILTSYPNLIARQMKLKKFEQPLFDATDYNGFGRKVRTSFNPTGGPVPKFNEVKNNSGVESVDEKVTFNGKKYNDIKLKKYKNFTNLDNLAVPYISPIELYFKPTISIDGIVPKSYSFSSRVSNDNKNINDEKDKDVSIYRRLEYQKYDFVTIELGMDSYLQLEHPFPQTMGLLRFYEIIDFLKNKKTKGAIANIPAITDLPYYYQVTVEQLKKGVNGQGIFVEAYWDYLNSSTVKEITPEYLVYPNSKIDSLGSSKVHIALKKGVNPYYPISFNGNFLSKTNYSLYLSDNNFLAKTAEKLGFALVDLHNIYKQIMQGSYITDDGIRVENKINPVISLFIRWYG